jgi:3-oxoacyl-(acyl-carrier-protein) synthase
VKITGIGPVTPAGVGTDSFWKGINNRRSWIRPLGQLGDHLGSFVAAQVANSEVKKIVSLSEVPRGVARHSIFALAAARLAISDAGIDVGSLRSFKVAIVSGSSLLDFGGIGKAIRAVCDKGAKAAQARVVYTTTLTAIPQLVAKSLGVDARTLSVQSSCCSGMDAVGCAALMVESGEVDIAICGGTEAPLYQFPLLEMRAADLTPSGVELADQVARPFDLWRTTGVVSEGAAMLVLEPENSPREGYCEVAGYGYSSDSPGVLCSGMTTAARNAASRGLIDLDAIDSISAWGPGHKSIDAAEFDAMEGLFGGRLCEIPVSSIKGSVGAALGAAPAIQIAATAIGMRRQVILPTVNWRFQDPDCPFSLSPDSRIVDHRYALVNSHGVGDINSAMILKKW